MTALSITAANVSLDSGAHDVDCIAGEAFNAGQALYKSSSDGKWYKAQCDGTADEAGATDYGIALGTASGAGARVSVAKDGAILSVGSTVALAGYPYFIGAAYGAIVPFADLVSTNKSTLCAMGYSTSKLLVCSGRYNSALVLA